MVNIFTSIIAIKNLCLVLATLFAVVGLIQALKSRIDFVNQQHLSSASFRYFSLSSALFVASLFFTTRTGLQQSIDELAQASALQTNEITKIHETTKSHIQELSKAFTKQLDESIRLKEFIEAQINQSNIDSAQQAESLRNNLNVTETRIQHSLSILDVKQQNFNETRFSEKLSELNNIAATLESLRLTLISTLSAQVLRENTVLITLNNQNEFVSIPFNTESKTKFLTRTYESDPFDSAEPEANCTCDNGGFCKQLNEDNARLLEVSEFIDDLNSNGRLVALIFIGGHDITTHTTGRNSLLARDRANCVARALKFKHGKNGINPATFSHGPIQIVRLEGTSQHDSRGAATEQEKEKDRVTRIIVVYRAEDRTE